VQLWALDFSFKDGSYTKRDLGQVSFPPVATSGVHPNTLRSMPGVHPQQQFSSSALLNSAHAAVLPPISSAADELARFCR
jgi:hypothetical protein